MNYLTLFEGETLFYKLKLVLGLRAKLDLRLTKGVPVFKIYGTQKKSFFELDKLFFSYKSIAQA